MILTVQTAGMESALQIIDLSGNTIASKIWDSGRLLSEQLLGKINELIVGQQAELADLKGIIVFSGPGSFTSLRIGHAVSNALADSLAIPIVGAMGESWIKQGLEELNVSQTKEPALPFYGAEANITKPKH